MRIILFFFAVLLVSCSRDGKFQMDQYKTNHIEFHQQHVDFIKAQKPLIDEALNYLIKSLDSSASFDVVMGHWNLFLKYTSEFKNKNDIFIADMIENDSTNRNIIRLRTSNTEISSMILPDKVNVEVNLRSPEKYPLVRTYIEKFNTQIPLKIDEMRLAAENYLTFCRK